MRRNEEQHLDVVENKKIANFMDERGLFLLSNERELIYYKDETGRKWAVRAQSILELIRKEERVYG